MELHYRGAIIRPIIIQTDRAFTSSVLISDPYGDRQLYEASADSHHEAAALFAVNWAIAQVDGKSH